MLRSAGMLLAATMLLSSTALAQHYSFNPPTSGQLVRDRNEPGGYGNRHFERRMWREQGLRGPLGWGQLAPGLMLAPLLGLMPPVQWQSQAVIVPVGPPLGPPRSHPRREARRHPGAGEPGRASP
jgi:hypothetical protein